MLGFALIGGVLVFWAIVAALVKHERGWVGDPTVIAFNGALGRLIVSVGDQLTPAIRRLGAEFAKLSEVLEKNRG